MSAPPPPAVEIDDGVIEEARRRQRRRRRGIGAVLAGAAIAAAVLGLSRGGGGSGPATGSVESGLGPGPVRLTSARGQPYVNGQLFPISVRPSLQVGWDGLSEMAFDGGGDASYPSTAIPLWGNDPLITQDLATQQPRVGPNGEIDYTLVEPGVAAVRVSGVGTFKPRMLPGLPPGVRIVVFYRAPGSPGEVVPPGFPVGPLPGTQHHHVRAITLTPLDAHGHVIPTARVEIPSVNGFRLPIVYWQTTNQTPRRASCAIDSSAPGLNVQWAEAATRLAADPSVRGPAFLPCTNVWYTLPGRAFEVALLLNAQHPGAPPASLWGATPVPGHPGIVQLAPVQWLQPPPPPGIRANRLTTLAPGAVAERVHGDWLLVQFGSLAQRLAFLNTLHVARLDVSPGR